LTALISAWFKAYQVTIFGCKMLLAIVLVQSALGVFICLKALLVAVKKDSRKMEERLGPVVRDRGWFHFFWMWDAVSAMSSKLDSLLLTSMREWEGLSSLSLMSKDPNSLDGFLERSFTLACVIKVWGESAEDSPESEFWGSDFAGELELGSTSDLVATLIVHFRLASLILGHMSA
jgi:hypothetical protein